MKSHNIASAQTALPAAPCTKHCRQSQITFRNSQPAQQPLFTSLNYCQQISLSSRGQTSTICLAAASVEYGELADFGVPADSYLVLGLAHCFEKNDEGKLSDRMVIEPIAANSLECMVLGAKTCFKAVTGLVLEEALTKDKSRLPEDFQGATFCNEFEYRCGASARTWLRPHAQDNLLWCHDVHCLRNGSSLTSPQDVRSVEQRVSCPLDMDGISLDLVPLGQTRTKFNFNLDEKRVLNFENEVSDEDNIKQDMSIDVYGRKDKDEEAKPAAPKAKAAPKAEAAPKARRLLETRALNPPRKIAEDDGDLDSLLST